MIYWFSGTGNSKYVAERLASATGERALSMASALKSGETTCKPGEGERLGFVFPVYFYGLPSYVSEFIDAFTARCAPDTYVYCALTCGGSTGDADNMFKRKLKEKGLPLTASFAVKLPDNYILLYNLQTDIDERLKRADEDIADIIERVRARAPGADKRLRGYAPGLMTGVLYPMYHVARRTRRFFANDQCTLCGRCADSCPTGAIRLGANKPEWIKPQCALCLRCLHLCPSGAVQYGGKTASRGRYAHPKSGLK